MLDNDIIVRQAITHALHCGCSAVRVSLYHTHENSVDVRNQEIESISHSTGCQLNISLYVDDRFSTISTNRLATDEIRSFITEGVRATRLLTPDPFRALPPKDVLYCGPDDNLDLYDESYQEVTFDDRISKANAVASELHHDKLISGVVSVSDGAEHATIATSDGFISHFSSSDFSISASACLQGDADQRTEDFDYRTTIRWRDLDGEGLGSQALYLASRKINPRRIPSGSYDIIVDRYVASRLFSPLLSALYGSAIHQQSSFLATMQGAEICSPILSVSDNPVQRGRFGAALFSSNGEQNFKLPIIKDGILQNFYISHYYSRKLSMLPTLERPMVLDFSTTGQTTPQLISTAKKAVYITGFNGGNSNPLTGDFSFGVEGFLIEEGAVVHPISEMLLTGNMLSLWRSLQSISSDPHGFSGCCVPSLLFSEQTLN